MPEVVVEGADRLAATLGAAGLAMGDLSRAHGAVARVILTRARQRAPIRSGRLAGSGRPDSTGTEAITSFGVPYAGPIQWGVGPRPGLRGPHNIRPTRFATNAMRDTEPQWVELYLDELHRILETVKGA